MVGEDGPLIGTPDNAAAAGEGRDKKSQQPNDPSDLVHGEVWGISPFRCWCVCLFEAESSLQ